MYHFRYNDVFLFGSILSFLVGVLIRSQIVIPLLFSLFIVLSAFFMCVFLIRTHRIYALFTLLFSLFFVLGLFRFEIKELSQQARFEDFKLQDAYYGKIIREVQYYSNYQRFVVKTDSNIRILVSTDRYPEFFFGDTVKIEGELRIPQNFITNTGREFDYQNYLLKDNIYFQMSYADVTYIDSNDTKGLRFILFSVKKRFLEAINRVVPEPESSLLGGILLGVDQSLGEDIEQDFIDTGTIHIVVLSGYNVTIVSEAIVKLFQTVMSGNVALLFGGFGIVLFALLSGASTTTVRASIMGLLGLLARVSKRNYDIFRAICVTAFGMVFINPFTLPYDISFQLSFIATLSLVLITPIIEQWKFITYIPKRFGIRDIFASTIGVQIGVLPFILYTMGNLSIIAPLANVLVLPVIPFAMGVGFFTGVMEAILNIGSNPISWIAFVPLHYVIKVVEFLASFSWSAISISHIPLIVVLLIYTLIIYWIYKKFSWK